jgi:hypothetical protein
MELITHLSNLTDKFLISFAAATTASWLGSASHRGARPSTAHHAAHHLSERITATSTHAAWTAPTHTAWTARPATHHFFHPFAWVFRGFTLFSVISALLSDFLNSFPERLLLGRALVSRSVILLFSVFLRFVLCHVSLVEARVEKAPGTRSYIGQDG